METRNCKKRPNWKYVSDWTIKVLESSFGIILAQTDVPTQVWHMIEIMRSDFCEHHQMQVFISPNQFGTMGMMSQIAEQVGTDYPEILESKYAAQPLNDFLFFWEEEESVDEGYVDESFE